MRVDAQRNEEKSKNEDIDRKERRYKWEAVELKCWQRD